MSANVFTVKKFLNETKEDFSSPTTSTFSTNLTQCKQMVNSIEENLDLDRNGLSKMKKAIKAIYNGGCADSENKIYLSEALEKLGLDTTNREKEEFIGAAFVKFSFIIKELSSLQKTLMQNLHNIILFPLENVLKGDLKGVKNDLKKPVDKAWKEYDIKMNKIEKEKKAQAKEVGLIRTEISGAEIAEEMDRERKQLQYQMCDYLIKVNEIETKKSFDLLLHFIEYFNAQCKYFRGGLEAIEQFQSYINELSVQLQQNRQRKEDEKRELNDLKSLLKTSSTLSDPNSWLSNSVLNDLNESQSNRRSIGYSLHQLQGNKQYGCNKSGYLLKKSESKMRVKVWQKRKCEVKDGFLFIWHSDESKPPTKVNLLTCQIKTNLPQNQEDRNLASTNSTNNSAQTNTLKNCGSYFDLVSCNRTYHLQVDDEQDAEAWISVLINSKDGALKKEFDSSSVKPCEVRNSSQQASLSKTQLNQSLLANDQSLKELQQKIIEQIRNLPGNDCCVDCGSTKDPTWLSINFGVLTCIECSGIHREMGVHVSRIQSLTLDNIGTSQLLIARSMSNNGFNDVMEASCNNQAQKPNQNSSMEERNYFIRNKYINKKYIIRTCISENKLLNDLEQAVQTKDIYFLLQVWAEGANLASPLPSNVLAETALHHAIMHEFDGSTLHIVDFLVQNCSNLNAKTEPDGNTALHYCVIYNRSECMKLLLRSYADYTIQNSKGKTPLDLAKEEKNIFIIELLECAINNKRALFENVLSEWSFPTEDPSTDFSDDDIEDKNLMLTPEEISMIRRSNPSSTNNSHFTSNQNNRLRNSNRKFSFKYPVELTDSESKDQANSANNTSIGFGNMSNSKLNSRPSSAIGSDNQPNSRNSNCQSFSSFKPAANKSEEIDQLNSFVRGGSANQTRNSNRNRSRLSTGGDVANLFDSGTKVNLETSKAINNTNKNFIAGHSRAASADISGYPSTNIGKQQVSINTGQATKIPFNKNGQYHHVRNNSVDNSLVTSVYPNFAINSKNSANINKPAIPMKPPGIVSVFVPGSMSTNSEVKNLNNLSENNQEYLKDLNKSSPSTTVSNSQMSVSPQTQTVSYLQQPVPPPRKKPQDSHLISCKYRRCVALYDCEADQSDELSFRAGEIINVINEVTNDDQWMEGMIENDPSRKGLFPAIFVEFI